MLKKLTLILSFLLMTSFLSFGVSAATKQDVINAAVRAVPVDYNFLYLIQFENILAQTELSPEKYGRIIEIIGIIEKSLKDSGQSLHFYTDENRNFLLEYFDEICTICGFTYEFDIAAKNPQWHPGDVICMVYDSEGRLIGMFDGDQDRIVNKTDAADHVFGLSFMLPLCASCLMTAAFIIRRKALLNF